MIFGFLLGKGDKISLQATVPTSIPTVSLSPEQIYAEEITEVLGRLAFFVDVPLTKWYDLMSTTSNGGLPYSDYLVYYPTIFYYSKPIELEESDEYQTIMFAANEVINAGFDTASELGSINPPASIKVAHDELYACVEYEIDHMNAITDLLETGVYEDAVSNCRAFSPALEKILQFVVEYGIDPPEIENQDLLSDL